MIEARELEKGDVFYSVDASLKIKKICLGVCKSEDYIHGIKYKVIGQNVTGVCGLGHYVEREAGDGE